MSATGQKMKIPYSMTAKVLSFPWAHHMKTRGLRMMVIGFIGSHFIFYQLHTAVNSPANVNMWKGIRDARKRYYRYFILFTINNLFDYIRIYNIHFVSN